MAIEPELELSMSSFETKETLRESLRQTRVSNLLLGEGAEAPRDFFCLEVGKAGSTVAKVGLISNVVGGSPSFRLYFGLLWVGFNDRVAVICSEPLRLVKEVELQSVFWTFLDVPGCGHVCVLCETAIAAVSLNGTVLWRVDTDLITDFSVDGTIARLQPSDAPSIRVDLISGNRLPGREA